MALGHECDRSSVAIMVNDTKEQDGGHFGIPCRSEAGRMRVGVEDAGELFGRNSYTDPLLKGSTQCIGPRRIIEAYGDQFGSQHPCVGTGPPGVPRPPRAVRRKVSAVVMPEVRPSS